MVSVGAVFRPAKLVWEDVRGSVPAVLAAVA